MKSWLKSLICVIILCSVLCTSASAAFDSNVNTTRSNAYIGACIANIYANSDGTVTVTFTTAGTDIMDLVGASAIRVYKSDGTRVTALSGFARTDMLRENSYTFSSSVTIDVEDGYSYYAVVRHYASLNGGSGYEELGTRTVYVA